MCKRSKKIIRRWCGGPNIRSSASGRITKEIQAGSRERGGGEGGCGDPSEFLNHGSEIGGVRGQHRGGCTPRRSGPLLWVPNHVGAAAAAVAAVVGLNLIIRG